MMKVSTIEFEVSANATLKPCSTARPPAVPAPLPAARWPCSAAYMDWLYRFHDAFMMFSDKRRPHSAASFQIKLPHFLKPSSPMSKK
jgi:hypothetical protein